MEAKLYTVGEEIFNSVSHGVGSLFAIIGSTVLVTMAAMKGSVIGVVAFIVYGLSMVILYTMSTLYHAFPMPGVKKIFRIFDHSTIFILIAGSYTPFSAQRFKGSFGSFYSGLGSGCFRYSLKRN